MLSGDLAHRFTILLRRKANCSGCLRIGYALICRRNIGGCQLLQATHAGQLTASVPVIASVDDLAISALTDEGWEALQAALKDVLPGMEQNAKRADCLQPGRIGGQCKRSAACGGEGPRG